MKRKRKKAFLITKVKEKVVFLPPKKFLKKRIVGAILLVCGSVLLTSSFFYFILVPNFFQKTERVQLGAKEAEKEVVKRVLIPRLNIDLPVEEARISGNGWLLPSEAVAVFPKAGSLELTRNLVLFGSDKENILSKLSLVKKRDIIFIFGPKQYRQFEVMEIKKVEPADESIFNETPEATLTIFSTTDYFKGKRFVVKAQGVF